ncbi:plasmid pRiA4b ORF-3 family protein [Georgenia yuyongxinii]
MADSHSALSALLAAYSGNPVKPVPWSAHPLRRRRRSKPVSYRVRLDLLDARPPIWRRLDLASNLRLDQVHTVIQVAMGWSDAHLHAFSAGGRPYMPDSYQFLNQYEIEQDEPGIPESEVRLDEVVMEPGDRLWYEYDFGDSWNHVLKLEKVLPRGANDPAATCLGGRRACPPEDCGGLAGYEGLLAFAEDPTLAPDWVKESWLHHFPDGYFDPAAFDVTEVNDALWLEEPQ